MNVQRLLISEDLILETLRQGGGLRRPWIVRESPILDGAILMRAVVEHQREGERALALWFAHASFPDVPDEMPPPLMLAPIVEVFDPTPLCPTCRAEMNSVQILDDARILSNGLRPNAFICPSCLPEVEVFT